MTFEIHHPSWYKRQAASRKHQAASVKPQAEIKNPKVQAKHLASRRLKLYEGSQIIELAACGLKLEACCLSLEPWDFFQSLGA